MTFHELIHGLHRAYRSDNHALKVKNMSTY